ncbi:hypothetical protein [Streptomyces sp. NPDC052179]|uniref:hypothetical protein n=1 Tax=Streptomyces sp. NPDC052179 TaxID=3155680 RepID=UPI00343F4B1A
MPAPVCTTANRSMPTSRAGPCRRSRPGTTARTSWTRRESADLLGVSPRSWDTYKHHPQLTGHMVEVGGVEHWPRAAVEQFRADRPGRAAAAGRPTGSGDQVPHEQLLGHTAALLDADPTVSAATVVDAAAVHRNTAQDALLHLRALRMAELLHAASALTPGQATAALGCPAAQVRRATVRAGTVVRALRVAPYLAAVAQALHREGWTATDTAPDVQASRGRRLRGRARPGRPRGPGVRARVGRAARVAHHDHPAASARPARSEARAVDGIRYLATGGTPPRGDLIAALAA